MVEGLIARTDEIYKRALKGGQLNAAVNANKEVSILAGLRIERREIGAPGEFAGLGTFH